jgi:hypothetical protein
MGAADGSTDTGYFGPSSVSWQVHREVTVLFGGARALLMQAAHPLVVAGATQTGMYDRNPWKRLQRTLILTYTLTFGTKVEAHAAAERINDIHARINGIDPVTGLRYDALDPQLLLYVHGCLVESALLFEHLTVGRLDAAARQRFHEEQMLAAELCLLPRDLIPPTVHELRRWLADVAATGILRVTETAPDASRTCSSIHLLRRNGGRSSPACRASPSARCPCRSSVPTAYLRHRRDEPPCVRASPRPALCDPCFRLGTASSPRTTSGVCEPVADPFPGGPWSDLVGRSGSACSERTGVADSSP